MRRKLGEMGAEPGGLAFELMSKERVLVSVQDGGATPDQWNAYLECVRSLKDQPEMRFLVCVEGPPPAPAMQARIAEAVRGHRWRVALVSSSAAMRFVVSAFSLVNKTIRFFSPQELRDALAHIGCALEEQPAVQAVVERLWSQSRS